MRRGRTSRHQNVWSEAWFEIPYAIQDVIDRCVTNIVDFDCRMKRLCSLYVGYLWSEHTQFPGLLVEPRKTTRQLKLHFHVIKNVAIGSRGNDGPWTKETESRREAIYRKVIRRLVGKIVTEYLHMHSIVKSIETFALSVSIDGEWEWKYQNTKTI